MCQRGDPLAASQQVHGQFVRILLVLEQLELAAHVEHPLFQTLTITFGSGSVEANWESGSRSQVNDLNVTAGDGRRPEAVLRFGGRRADAGSVRMIDV